jgi:hypothetical protein
VKKQRVIWSRVLNQPVHRSEYVRFGGLAHGAVLVVGQGHHILSFVSKVAVQIRAHVLDIVDAATELASLSKIVDTDQ